MIFAFIKVSKELLKQKIYKQVKDFYGQILNDLYTNLQLFR